MRGGRTISRPTQQRSGDGPAERGSSLYDAPVFAARAESHRRAGLPADAERVAREGLRDEPDAIAGRVALGLALLDQGRSDEARAELERAMEAMPGFGTSERPAPGPEASAEPKGASATPDAVPSELVAEPIDDQEIDRAFEQAETCADQMLDATAVAQQVLRAEHLDAPESVSAPEGSSASTPQPRGDRTRKLATLERWLEKVQRGSP